MRKTRNIKGIICKVVMCLGIVGATLLIISLHRPQDYADTDFSTEEAKLSEPEETPPHSVFSSVPAYEQDIEEETSEPEQTEQVQPPHYDYTEEEIDMLAKLVYAEAGGCAADEQRLVVWTVFQRIDSDDWDFRDMNDITTTLTAPNQFAYYPRSPIIEEIRGICAEEIAKWAAYEQPPTVEPYAPSLPYYFYDGDGYHNWFRAEW